MGNNHHLLDTWSVKFIQNMDDHNFGNIDIYKNIEGQFIMCTRRTFIKTSNAQQDRRLQHLCYFLNYASQSRYCGNTNYGTSNSTSNNNDGVSIKNDGLSINNDGVSINNSGYTVTKSYEIIAPILHCNITQQKNLCIIYQTYDIYTQYLNFTLHDMIKYKKQMDTDELWLCFKWMLTMGTIFLQQQWDFNQPNSCLDKIFVTLKGLPIIYFQHIYHRNEAHNMIEQQLQPCEQSSPLDINNSKHSSNDSNAKIQQQMLHMIALSMLQLSCMTIVSPKQNNSLFIRKCQKLDKKLGAIINQILNNMHKNPNLTINNMLQVVAQLQYNKQIIVGTSIKLNKFRYAIPTGTSNNDYSNINNTNNKVKINNIQPSISEDSKQLMRQAELAINKNGIKMLNGRKQSCKRLHQRQKQYCNKNQQAVIGSNSKQSKWQQFCSDNNKTAYNNNNNAYHNNNSNNNSNRAGMIQSRKKILSALQSRHIQSGVLNSNIMMGCQSNSDSDGTISNNRICKNSSQMLSSLKQSMENKKQQIQQQKQRISSRKQAMMAMSSNTNTNTNTNTSRIGSSSILGQSGRVANMGIHNKRDIMGNSRKNKQNIVGNSDNSNSNNSPNRQTQHKTRDSISSVYCNSFRKESNTKNNNNNNNRISYSKKGYGVPLKTTTTTTNAL